MDASSPRREEPSQAQPGPRAARIDAVLIAAGLGALVLAVFWRAKDFAFVNFDDPVYVTRNPAVLRGLTWDGVVWAFAGFHAGNWHPLTWLSHMADVQLFGPGPAPAHLVNVFLHLANTLLLFAFLRSATGATWRSAVVAALFAVHPLHVESVAWVSERKDLLSTVFLLSTLLAWLRYARGGGWRPYLVALLLFALGLLAKPMVVTLPFLLLLLDFWPLGRAPLLSLRALAAALPRLVLEKVPFFALSAGACAATWFAQSSGGGESAVSPISAWPRAANAIVSYASYPLKALWPTSLAAFYPHPATVRPTVAVLPFALAAAALAVVSGLAIRHLVRWPWFAWGWLWYLGTLVPVIGFVQVGGQAMADRYTYVPLIGLFVAAVWGFAELAERLRIPRWAGASAAAVATLSFAAVALHQVEFWSDSVTLHEHSIAVTQGNWKSWHGLCTAFHEEGRLREAASACESAILTLPSFPEGWQTLGVIRAEEGDPKAAIPLFLRALELRPDYFNALHNLGSTFGNLGNNTQAVAYFRRALTIRPDDAETLSFLGLALWREGDRRGAQEVLSRLQSIDPERAESLRTRLAP